MSRECDTGRARRKLPRPAEHRHWPYAVSSRSFSTKGLPGSLGTLHLTQPRNLSKDCDRPHTAHVLHGVRAPASLRTCLGSFEKVAFKRIASPCQPSSPGKPAVLPG